MLYEAIIERSAFIIIVGLAFLLFFVYNSIFTVWYVGFKSILYSFVVCLVISFVIMEYSFKFFLHNYVVISIILMSLGLLSLFVKMSRNKTNEGKKKGYFSNIFYFVIVITIFSLFKFNDVIIDYKIELLKDAKFNGMTETFSQLLDNEVFENTYWTSNPNADLSNFAQSVRHEAEFFVGNEKMSLVTYFNVGTSQISHVESNIKMDGKEYFIEKDIWYESNKNIISALEQDKLKNRDELLKLAVK